MPVNIVFCKYSSLMKLLITIEIISGQNRERINEDISLLLQKNYIYHTGRDPATGGTVRVSRSFQEKKEQKRMLSS